MKLQFSSRSTSSGSHWAAKIRRAALRFSLTVAIGCRAEHPPPDQDAQGAAAGRHAVDAAVAALEIATAEIPGSGNGGPLPKFVAAICSGQLGVYLAPKGAYTTLVFAANEQVVLTTGPQMSVGWERWTGGGVLTICDQGAASLATVGTAFVIDLVQLSPTSLLVNTIGPHGDSSGGFSAVHARIQLLTRDGGFWHVSPQWQLQPQYAKNEGFFLAEATDGGIVISDRRANTLRVVVPASSAVGLPQVATYTLGGEPVRFAAQATSGGAQQLAPFVVGTAPDGEVRLYSVRAGAAPHIEQFASFRLPPVISGDETLSLGQIVRPSRARVVGSGHTYCESQGEYFTFDAKVDPQLQTTATAKLLQDTPLGRVVVESAGAPASATRCLPWALGLSARFGLRGQRLYAAYNWPDSASETILACVESLANPGVEPARWCKHVENWLPEGPEFAAGPGGVSGFWRKGGLTLVLSDSASLATPVHLFAMIVADEFGNVDASTSGPCGNMILEDCADPNPCTADLCDANHGGCYHEPLPDGLGCGGSAVCKAGVCQ